MLTCATGEGCTRRSSRNTWLTPIGGRRRSGGGQDEGRVRRRGIGRRGVSIAGNEIAAATTGRPYELCLLSTCVGRRGIGGRAQMMRFLVIVICIGEKQTGTNGSCPSREREVISTETSGLGRVDGANVCYVYPPWTDAFWPCRCDDCFQLDFDAGYPCWFD